MANTYPKLLAAIAAAAFLTATPVYAQNNSGSVGGGAADVYPSQDLDERVNPMKQQMGETFRGLGSPPAATNVAVEATIGATVPDTVVLAPVPAEIVAVAPETEGYEYFTLPDGKIVIVHPGDNTIATIIE